MKSLRSQKFRKYVFRISVGMFVAIISFTLQQPICAQQDSLKAEVIASGFKNAISLYVTANHVYVVDQDVNQLVKLDHFGNETDRIGGNGRGDYQFSRPVDVDATNGLKIYISDFNNRRVQIFDRRGQYLSSLEAPLNDRNARILPTQLVVNGVGEIFFYNESGKTIERYGFNGSHTNSYRLPRDIAQVDDIIFHGRSFYVLDKKKSVIHLLSENWIPETFYEAENVNTFTVDEENIWLIKNFEIIRDDGREEKTYKWKAPSNSADAQIFDNILFILDRQNLYKIALPD